MLIDNLLSLGFFVEIIRSIRLPHLGTNTAHGMEQLDCYGPTVEEHEIKANADHMSEHLKQYGWEYIVVDIRWFVENDKTGGYNQTDPRYVMDEHGRYLPAVNRLPSAASGDRKQAACATRISCAAKMATPSTWWQRICLPSKTSGAATPESLCSDPPI
jgi:hypothetical protein